MDVHENSTGIEQMYSYLAEVKDQIRCEKARPMIEEEMKHHIDDQQEALMQQGKSKEEALVQAVREMGDPVKAGVALDKVHRPKMKWEMVGLVVLLSLVGLTMQIIIIRSGMEDSEMSLATYRSEMIRQTVLNCIISIGVMLATCYLDYSFIGAHPLAFWITAILVTGMLRFGTGARYYIAGENRMAYYVIILSLPLYGGVLYYFRGRGKEGFFCSIALALLMFFAGSSVGQPSVMIEFSAVILMMLTYTVWKGWFGEHKAIKIACMWGAALAAPMILAVLSITTKANIASAYHIERLQIYLDRILGTGRYATTANYTWSTTREAISNISLFGSAALPIDRLPSIQNDYIVTSLFLYFGSLIGIAVLFMVTVFIVKAFKISITQKNQLGSLIGFSAASALFVKTFIYVLSNFGLGVISQRSMPFLSYGFGNALANAVLAGLLLSVYRHSDILGESKVKSPKIRFRSPIEKI